MTSVLRLLIVVLVGLLPSFSRAEEPKALSGIALVIGQSDYEHLAALPNPANDARAVAKLLTDLGFEVDQVSDGDARKLQKALRRFAEDAEGADAAVLYYSGHGIEAGGENWLVPVDANLEALSDAPNTLVPISQLLNELKATVPVTVLLLDACRSNPFPAGALLRSADKPEGLPLAAAGLSPPRGFAAIEGGASESLGTVIGFAAEPGQPALDGEPGGNSPYAAALIRHLSAMNGEEFGLVMRMVTEEVYLKTKAQQRPWVNESLRRQLYFGLYPDEPKGEDGVINGERRQLLLTIAALPLPDRKRVEMIARNDGVPMDALYGVLRAMGEDNLPKDAATLEKVLYSQSAKIKKLLDERQSLNASDPDILRLAAAADRAISEGAIKAARAFLDEAKTKVGATVEDIEAIEKLVREKRIANAAILEKSADAAALDFDHAAEARDYRAAYEWVKSTDRVLAWRYKNREADAWQSYGEISGDAKSLDTALTEYEAALAFVERAERPMDWAKTQHNIANTLLIIGKRDGGNANLEKAIAGYKLALEVMTRMADAKAWAQAQSNLAIALEEYGARTHKVYLLGQAEFAYAQVLKVRTRDSDPVLWAETQVNLGSLLVTKSDEAASPESLDQAVRAFDLSLEVLTRDGQFRAWSSAKNNLGIVWRKIGDTRKDTKALAKSAAVYEELVAAYPREKFPIDWGQAMNNLGITMISLGEQEKGTETLRKALHVLDEAAAELTYERSPIHWAKSTAMRTLALHNIAMRTPGTAEFERVIALSQSIVKVFPRESGSDHWASAQLQMASAYLFLGTRRAGHGDFEKSAEGFKNAHDFFVAAGNKQFAAAAKQGLDLVTSLIPAK